MYHRNTYETYCTSYVFRRTRHLHGHTRSTAPCEVRVGTDEERRHRALEAERAHVRQLVRLVADAHLRFRLREADAFESELEHLLSSADGLTVLQNEIIPGSVDNRFQVLFYIDSQSLTNHICDFLSVSNLLANCRTVGGAAGRVAGGFGQSCQ